MSCAKGEWAIFRFIPFSANIVFFMSDCVCGEDRGGGHDNANQRGDRISRLNEDSDNRAYSVHGKK